MWFCIFYFQFKIIFSLFLFNAIDIIHLFHSLQTDTQENDNRPANPEDESMGNEEEADEPPPQGTTVFVKNLNFDTTQEKFKKVLIILFFKL